MNGGDETDVWPPSWGQGFIRKVQARTSGTCGNVPVLAPMNLFGTLLGVGIATVGVSALANQSFFVAPDFRGAGGGAYALYAGWETFTVPVISVATPQMNAPDLANSTSLASLAQFNESASLTGTGNLYNQNGVSSFAVGYAGLGFRGVDKVALQGRTLGSEVNYHSFMLEYGASSLSGTRTELERTSFGPPPGTPGSGFSVTSSIVWNLPENPTGPLTIKFLASDVSVSFDSANLDVRLVPEPSTWALLGLGGVAMVLVQRRRSRN